MKILQVLLIMCTMICLQCATRKRTQKLIVGKKVEKGVDWKLLDDKPPYQKELEMNQKAYKVAKKKREVKHRYLQRKTTSIAIRWDSFDFALISEQFPNKFKLRRAPPPTVGKPWPMPYEYSTGDRVYKIDLQDFSIDVTDVECDIIHQAIGRYRKTFSIAAGEFHGDNMKSLGEYGLHGVTEENITENIENAVTLKHLLISIETNCSYYPDISSDESYSLLIKPTRAIIKAREVWGALRGLETFSQLIFRKDGQYLIRDTTIQDVPRFPHRGVLIDSSRHFVHKNVIQEVLEGMVMNKMNVFHWHIVDDQSFPYESQIFPELSAKGAYHPSLVYTFSDIEEIIEYARLRGIRVIPEFDTPGHTFSWGYSHPELLTKCYRSRDRPVPGFYGPMDPSKNSTYEFMAKFFREAIQLFPDNFFHLGGDEVLTDCWQSNPSVRSFAADLNDTEYYGHYSLNGDIRILVDYYMQRLSKNVSEIGAELNKSLQFIVWEEVFKNRLNISQSDAIINVWLGHPKDVGEVTRTGYRALYSSCWYLDHIDPGVHWPKYYRCDPTGPGFYGNESLVLGGEACLWSEYIASNDVIRLLWPRASAAAERLWSNSSVRDVEQAGRRLQEHRCRMYRRGLNVGHINGPDYCILPKDRGLGPTNTYLFSDLTNSFQYRLRRGDLWIFGTANLALFTFISTLCGLSLFLCLLRVKFRYMSYFFCKWES